MHSKNVGAQHYKTWLNGETVAMGINKRYKYFGTPRSKSGHFSIHKENNNNTHANRQHSSSDIPFENGRNSKQISADLQTFAIT